MKRYTVSDLRELGAQMDEAALCDHLLARYFNHLAAPKAVAWKTAVRQEIERIASDPKLPIAFVADFVPTVRVYKDTVRAISGEEIELYMSRQMAEKPKTTTAPKAQREQEQWKRTREPRKFSRT